MQTMNVDFIIFKTLILQSSKMTFVQEISKKHTFSLLGLSYSAHGT